MSIRNSLLVVSFGVVANLIAVPFASSVKSSVASNCILAVAYVHHSSVPYPRLLKANMLSPSRTAEGSSSVPLALQPLIDEPLPFKSL
jgi:hypothetical protein